MKRGVGAKWFNGDELAPCELWVERTERNEVQLRIVRPEEQGRDRELDVYVTLDECEVLDTLLTAARAEGWRRA